MSFSSHLKNVYGLEASAHSWAEQEVQEEDEGDILIPVKEEVISDDELPSLFFVLVDVDRHHKICDL